MFVGTGWMTERSGTGSDGMEGWRKRRVGGGVIREDESGAAGGRNKVIKRINNF